MSKEAVWIRDNEEVVPKFFVEHHTSNCIDKEKVRYAIAKVLGIVHFSGVPIITAEEKRSDRHNYFEELWKELEL